LPSIKPVFAEALRALAICRRVRRIGADRSDGAPRFDQDWFPRLGCRHGLSLVRRFQPAGSSKSDRPLDPVRGARRPDGGWRQRSQQSIPPLAPDIAKLRSPVARAVPHCGAEPFEALRPGDLLMDRFSHI